MLARIASNLLRYKELLLQCTCTLFTLVHLTKLVPLTNLVPLHVRVGLETIVEAKLHRV